MLRERTALQDAQHVKAVADAVMKARAREYDPTRTAIGLAVIAATVAGDNQTAKTMLAFTFLKMAKELDADVFDAKFN
jgi:hypothetical protein